jgi:hypothetical protein
VLEAVSGMAARRLAGTATPEPAIVHQQRRLAASHA